MAEKEERLGPRESKKGGRQRFYCILNYRSSETKIPIGCLLVNLSTTKTSQSQKSLIFQGSSNFCSTWCTELLSSFQMEDKVFKEANCLNCETWIIFLVKIISFLQSPKKFQYVMVTVVIFKQFAWSITLRGFFAFFLSSSLALLKEPYVFQDHQD